MPSRGNVRTFDAAQPAVAEREAAPAPALGLVERAVGSFVERLEAVPGGRIERRADGRCAGYTPEYIYVLAKNAEPGTLAEVRLSAVIPEGMSGGLVE